MIRLIVQAETPEETVLQVDGWVSEENVSILEQEGTRLPGVRRLALRAAAARDGVAIPTQLYDELKALSATA